MEINVVKVEAGKHPVRATLKNSLADLQKAVGGQIEILSYKDNIDILLNEEGKLIRLEPNRKYCNDVLCGTFYFIGCNVDGETISLNEKQMEAVIEDFWDIDEFDKDFNVQELMRIRIMF